ncbi:MAG: thiamine diphosphokinase [Lachnospiraceae bacterium]|nr:thiamine diphosphokinase [Lachnospiraceae bacterium]
MGKKENRRCLILGQAEIKDYETMRRYLRPDDYVVCCDGGFRHAEGLGIPADLIVGDFDSIEKPELDTEIIVLPREKDDTDSVFAVKECLRRGYQSFLFLGVIGQRLDHTLGNLSILLMLDTLGCKALMADDLSEMEIVSRRPASVPERFPLFSLICTGEEASGIEITGAKYPLSGGRITAEYQYGISNEVLPGQEARISVREGRLLLIRLRNAS